jgi:peptide chain release factor subunit 1
MLTDQEIRSLVEFESPDAPVLSVYLNVDPRQRSADAYRLALRNLLDDAENASPEDRERVYNFVEMGYNWQGRGLAMYSCAAKDFWWARAFPVPVQDFGFVSFRPYVRQLASLQDKFERYGVIHIDSEGARLYLFDMGVLQAADGYMGREVKLHRAGGWASARYQRHEKGQAIQNLQDAAEMAEEFYRGAGTRRLILAGTDKNVAQFKELLSNRLRSMVVGSFAVQANASPSEISERALELMQRAEEADDRAVADHIISLSGQGGNAVLGLANTLTAVQEMRAERIAVIGDFAQPAYRFVDNGLIVLEISEDGDLGSGRIQPLPDAVESVIRRSMAQGIGVTILDEHKGLKERGSIGALTRY